MLDTLRSKPTNTRLWIHGSFIGFVLLTGATVLNAALDGRVSLISQSFVYVLCVVITARYALPVVSVGVAMLAVIALNFFFVDPRYTLAVEHPEHVFALVGMLVLAVVISRLAADLRKEALHATIHARRAQHLQILATELADARTELEVKEVAQRHLQVWLPSGIEIRFETVTQSETQSMDAELSLSDGHNRLGRWIWSSSESQTDEDLRAHLRASKVLLTQALRRVQARESQRVAEIDAEQQRVRSAFLAAISHDLRTPLATIMGAASALRLQQDRLARDDRENLLESIVQEAQYLSNIADNTLQLVRLSNSNDALATEWESIEEIVGAALSRVRSLDTERRIDAKVDANLPLIRGNAILLVQLLVNLLENALRHARGQVMLQAERAPENMIQIVIEDDGPGVTSRPDWSSVEYRRNRESAGLGLTLCHAIAKAHGGTLSLSDRSSRGTRVTLMLKTAIEADQAHNEP